VLFEWILILDNCRVT